MSIPDLPSEVDSSEQGDQASAAQEKSIAIVAAFTLAGMLAVLLLLPYSGGLWNQLPWGAAQLTPRATGEVLTAESRLTLRGIGPVRIGMTPDEAAIFLGRPLLPSKEKPRSEQCSYAEIDGGPGGIYFMVISGKIARIDIENPAIETRAGARIGTRERLVLSMYPGRIKVEQHKYAEKGHYLVFTPKDPADRDYLLVFETDGKVVTTFRAGRLPEVRYVEQCL